MGGGQLGQMLMLAGYPLGIESSCFDQSPGVPAGKVGTVVAAELTDSDTLHEWAKTADVLTYEFENFPVELLADLAAIRPLRPGVNALAAAQDRWAEKRLLNDLEIPVPPFRTVSDEAQLRAALSELKWPLVAKTRTGGYDGKGQAVIRTDGDITGALELISNAGDVIVEEYVDFTNELSVIGVRSKDGEVVVYPVVENEHRKGILHSSRVPAEASSEVAAEAARYMQILLKKLQYVGVLTLELFNTPARLLANEMAPRVHNSGHWTIEGAATSQFENHMRAITGLPLGSTELRGPTVMVNLVGRLPRSGDVLAIPGAHLHLYGKTTRPGRKVGHVTVTAGDEYTLQARLEQLDSVVQNEL